MFTKEDYKEYFNTIEDKESGMVDYCKKIRGIIEDPEVLKEIDAVLKDEIKHVILARKLYAYL